MKNLLNLFIVPAFLFCSFQKKSELALLGDFATEKSVKKADRIMYLFFRTDKDLSGNAKIVLQETKISEGRLKFLPSFDRNEIREGDFVITIIKADGKEAAQQLVKNPLNPELEVYEKEGISRHQASLQNAEFSVRFSYAEDIRSVKIEKATEDGLQLLFTQKL
ncbi:hypothetical protein [Chryseobacterium sp.]|uniref:hypothetical protein n=1 Tax=Chryseobacterium sp. TaxID=1871047 RepID=UPI0025B953F8|nr:hypothetical protein [Chryseobacterium sp.]MBV8328215.1 hypothetical protein [Chryseobacterium sp.]